MKQNKVLLGENDYKFAEELTKTLKSEGFMVESETTWDSVYSNILNGQPQITLINTSLPGMSVFNAIKEIRSFFDGLIILLSDQNSNIDQILSFELGVDDYIVKPVHLRLLMARIHALLRRNPLVKKNNSNKYVSVGNLTVDAARREAYLSGQSVDLTTIQFDLLWVLISNAGDVVSRDDLCKEVRETNYDGIDRSIDVYISRIRQKLGDDPSNPYYLKTVRGTGYLFAGEKGE